MSLTVATSVVGKSVAAIVAKKFGGAVIERWTRYRAERFFEGFVETIGIESLSHFQSDEVDKRLATILADETKSEVLFDAYRRVCFSKSKTFGPRIIGLLTGQLVHEGRMADYTEEHVFEAAEILSDGDFTEFMKSYKEHRKKAEGVTYPNGEHSMLGDSVIVRWTEQTGHEVDIGSFPWEDALGRWAVYLKQCGLLEERVQQELLRSREVEGVTSTSVNTTIIFCSGCARLYELLLRSLGPETTAA